MKIRKSGRFIGGYSALTVFVASLVFLPAGLSGQGKLADYERAFGLRDHYLGLVRDLPERAVWIDKTNRFWYRKNVKGSNEFVLVDAAALAKKAAFDQEKLAASLSAASGEKVDPKKLPFSFITFVDNEKAVEFDFLGWRWKCNLATFECTKIRKTERRFGGGLAHRAPLAQAASSESKPSPDGQWEAFIRNYNVWVRPKGKEKKDEFALSQDGSEGNYYLYESLVWSPDSKKLVAFRVRPGYRRVIPYIESSPAGQLQPKYSTFEYAKPGDALDVEQPVLFHLESKAAIDVSNTLFPNPYEISELAWRKDSRAFTFEYNQRGHQVYRVIEVDASTGAARAVINEECPTFFSYSGKKYRHDVGDGKEVVWMSERDGWNHLYLYDGITGSVKNQITKGEWVVRAVDRVDEEARQVYFRASGVTPGLDPYFVHLYRINFDGAELMRLTEGEGTHAITISPDASFYLDTWSRVDFPTVMELRRASDNKVLMRVEEADIQALLKAGWRAPEAFTAKGRDGRTDIWGIIIRPRDFNPKKKYPVVESIYAGPHSSFVPKAFSPYYPMQALAELGFIVVQIDGMGTSNRSKAFHDVCWKNLADAGFPDRILWHRAVAARYPFYDISRVGIYGHSAGGQNALAALLFHPEFYDAAVSSCGCHDNRMDKIWWNEQWMGWPLGPEYAASSNVDNAWRLQGKLLLSVGEMDQNVDPASTMQVVNALIKADKTFDLLVLPGQGHTTGGEYGDRKRYDFFVRHLLGVEPPDWNQIAPKKPEEK